MGPFPVDEETLCLLDQALAGSSERSSVHELLEILSGYDPARRGLPQGEDLDEIYHPNDVIRALVDEVRRLRREREEARVGPGRPGPTCRTMAIVGGFHGGTCICRQPEDHDDVHRCLCGRTWTDETNRSVGIWPDELQP